jgi:hypothetical protein
MKQPEYLWVYVLWGSVIVSTLLIYGIVQGARRAGLSDYNVRRTLLGSAVVVFGWLAFTTICAWMGVFEPYVRGVNLFLPLAVAIPMISAQIFLPRNGQVKQILAAIPQEWLIGIQAYRGLGSIFLVLCGQHLMPREFALPAGFGDATVGVLALPLSMAWALGWKYRRAATVAWNVLGISDLLIALTMGFLTSPSLIQVFALDSPNRLVSAFPAVLIPTFAVPISIVLHFVSLGKLRSEPGLEKEIIRKGTLEAAQEASYFPIQNR